MKSDMDSLLKKAGELQDELHRRAAELALINSVQQGLAARLDFQSIVDLVGDKLRKVFKALDLSIGWYDENANLIHYLYVYEHGKRLAIPSAPPQPGGRFEVMRKSHQPYLVNSTADFSQINAPVIPGTDRSLSLVSVPIISRDRVVGIIGLENFERENAFGESEIRLLTTIAASLGSALENARLFDETQRLLKETNQRNAELAILNSVSEAMAKTMDVKSMTRIVGDKVRDIFDADSVLIMLLDRHTNYIHIPYEYDKNEGGFIDYVEPFPFGKGLASKVITSGRSLMVGTLEEEIANGAYFPPEIIKKGSGMFSQSWLGVPITVNEQVLGIVALADARQHAFNDYHLRLLQTLSSNMGVAIENARLFQAEQQRAAELATINTVSNAMAGELDLSALIKLVGGQIRSVFKADIAYVALLDKESSTIRFPYQYGEKIAPLKFGQGLTSRIIQSGRPLLINQEMEIQRRKLGTKLVGKRARSFLGVPVFAVGEAIGVVSVQNTAQEGVFTEDDQRLLATIASNVGIALQNARLFEEIKRQEQVSLETQRRLADIIDFLPDATLVIDHEGRVIAWNRAIEEMSGVRAHDMIGKGDYEYAVPFYGERRPILIDLVLLPRQEVEKKYAHIHRAGGILTGETYTPALKGGARYLYATASALHDGKGSIVGAIETIRDITGRKHSEEELSEAKAAAEQANQAKSAFLATMSHEIRTPMNAVIGMSSLLLDTPLTAEQREYAETIRNSGDTLLAVINDILDFSKIEAGKMDLEHHPFDLRECVESALDLISARAVEKGLDLAYVFEGEISPGILGDVTRLRQVLLNLFSNAVKFTEKGEVVLTVSKGRKKDELLFSVRDTGIGIQPELKDALFQSFSQADSSTTRKYGGTGLGLAICRRLVEMMGGSIHVRSDGVPGKGSTFSFTIHAESAVVPSRMTRKDLTRLEAILHGRRLLVVDDNDTNRRILHLQTQKWGMLPRETGSPKQALRWLKAGEPFDLCVLDMHMPGMDGVELANAIRKLPNGRSMPLAMFSSLGRRESRVEEVGFVAHLHKPLKPSQLFDALVGIFAVPIPDEKIKPSGEKSHFDAELGRRHPLRILLAEDNLVNQKVALRILEQLGYRADVASNGRETLQSVARQPYDVILMDIQMPEMDGLEATRQIIARWPKKKDRPSIVAMTANAMQSDREMCLAAGMDDYVAKPIRVPELMTALGNVKARK